jgi:hypothetical protein
MQAPSITDCIIFIRKSGILKDWTYDQLADYIAEAIKTKALLYLTDTSGNLKELGFGRWHSSCSIHVNCLIAKGNLRAYLNYLKTQFPQCNEITMYRRGNLRTLKLK